MATNKQTLDKDTIILALQRLNEKLQEGDTVGEICLFGGTAMVLAFNARLSTKDVDAVFKPPGIFLEASARIAEEMDLPSGWLNDGVKGFLSDRPTYTEDDMPQMSHLRVLRPSAEYLLAMKCMAARAPSYDTDGDRHDVSFLASILGLHTAEEILAIVEQYYDPEQILPKTQFLVREIIECASMERRCPPLQVTHLADPAAEPGRGPTLKEKGGCGG